MYYVVGLILSRWEIVWMNKQNGRKETIFLLILIRKLWQSLTQTEVKQEYKYTFFTHIKKLTSEARIATHTLNMQ